MTQPKCELCDSPACYVDSALSAAVYRTQYLCTAHAMERNKDSTARVERLEADVPGEERAGE